MFENIDTAIIQAIGFFAIFGFFVYQTLFTNPKSIKSIKNKSFERINDSKSIYKRNNKGLFNRKLEPIKEKNNIKKNGLFGNNKEVNNNELKSKKKGWFQ